MEDLDQVLKYYEDITLNEEGDSNSLPTAGTAIGQSIRRTFDVAVTMIWGRDALLKRRSNRFFLKLIRVEADSSLTIQNKIILISKVIAFCHETFGFAPGGLEKMLVKKVEEMKYLVISQLN